MIVGLADGTEISIRALRLNDREALTHFYGRLGQHSRYQRFFACPAELPASWADLLLDLSDRRLALVAEPVGEPRHIIALADFTVLSDRGSAEVGLVVADDWQHNGLGQAIFDRLLMVGESRGVRSFVAYVHWSNRRVILALDHMVTIVSRDFEAPTLKFTFTRRANSTPRPAAADPAP